MAKKYRTEFGHETPKGFVKGGNGMTQWGKGKNNKVKQAKIARERKG